MFKRSKKTDQRIKDLESQLEDRDVKLSSIRASYCEIIHERNTLNCDMLKVGTELHRSRSEIKLLRDTNADIIRVRLRLKEENTRLEARSANFERANHNLKVQVDELAHYVTFYRDLASDTVMDLENSDKVIVDLIRDIEKLKKRIKDLTYVNKSLFLNLWVKTKGDLSALPRLKYLPRPNKCLK